MAKFSATMARTASTTLSVGALTAAAANMRRFKIYEWTFGAAEATPADAGFVWEIQRCTTAGTAGSAVTPQTLDPADTLASTVVCGQAHSADPTLTANAILESVGLNQRAVFRWVAVPGCEIVAPATATNGFAFRTPTSSAVACRARVHFEEQ